MLFIHLNPTNSASIYKNLDTDRYISFTQYTYNVYTFILRPCLVYRY